MLYHLQPSVEITGGPWYTDNELDTEFIKLLSSACLHYVKDRVRVYRSKKYSTTKCIIAELPEAKTIRERINSLSAAIPHRCCPVISKR